MQCNALSPSGCICNCILAHLQRGAYLLHSISEKESMNHLEWKKQTSTQITTYTNNNNGKAWLLLCLLASSASVLGRAWSSSSIYPNIIYSIYEQSMLVQQRAKQVQCCWSWHFNQ